MPDDKKTYKAITIGGSAGSLDVLLRLFSFLPHNFDLPIIIVSHLHPQDNGGLVEFFSRETFLKVKEAGDKEQIQPGNIYFSPANYHLLVEREQSFSLSIDPQGQLCPTVNRCAV
jgi:two-component system chemotaxis response regulator CheB